jgi:3-hydroxybutyryl-CoA dehydrogenase/5-formyl-3-hydroxy-2-methylpyridine 4-carboxylate dehydrogenase
VASYLNQSLSDEKGVSKTATNLKDESRLGIKTGGGFFDYTPERIKELQQQRAAALVAVRKALD